MVDREDIQRAVEALRRGGLVAFPTETVYGLGADAGRADAVRRLYAVKRRPADHPVIVHLAGAEGLDAWAREVPPVARRLASRFWPGPLTLVLRCSSRVPDLVTGGAPTVGLRVPAHPVALDLLRAFGGALAAPSANRFGSVSPTRAEHVRADLGEDVDVILDGGPCPVGVESTIVDLSSSEPAILRPGGVSREQVEDAVGAPVSLRGDGAVRAPGTLEAHYAPRARVELVQPESLRARAAELQAAGERVVVLARSPAGLPSGVTALAVPADAEGMARELYAMLRAADGRGATVILTSIPPPEGLGLAVADRLRRAARR